MVLVPLLTQFTDTDDDQIFPTSVSIILPICIVSLVLTFRWEHFSFPTALPYLLGSAAGGILSGLFGRKLSTLWLHRILGVLIFWGGIRYLW